MAGIEYKVLEAKDIEAFREQVVQEGAQGWRVISMALSPTVFLCGAGKEGWHLRHGASYR